MSLAILALFIGISTVADSEYQYKAVDGLEIYLSVLPVKMVRGHPNGHTESSIHGGFAPGAE
jgi:hypothetical protein